MEGRQLRKDFPGGPSRSDETPGNSIHMNRVSDRQRMFRSSAQSLSSSCDLSKFPNSSITAPYSNTIPGLLYDPLLYPSIQRQYLMPHMHRSIPSSFRPSLTGLRPINPVLLLSSNDNNNCNSRSRAASHSSVLEVQQGGSLPIPYPHPMATNSQYPFFIPKIGPNILTDATSYRRNSTNTSILHERPPSQRTRDFNAPPPYDRPPPPYPSSGDASGMPRNSAFSQLVASQPVLRRDRYSVGGLLTTSDPIAQSYTLPRRNSIPTALEVQQISEESTENSSSVDDDDDDVFESSPPLTAPHSATDAASFLEQLRESRKRASTSSGAPSLSKYPCPNEELRRPRFRRCDNNEEHGARKDISAREEEQPLDNVPGTSHNLPSMNFDKSATYGKSTKAETDLLKPNQSSPEILKRKTMTPSPSILKNPKMQKPGTSGNNDHSSPAEAKDQSSSSTARVSRVKSLPLKKQVAWKDKPEMFQEQVEDAISPMKHDLSEHQLSQIAKNPNDFTEKNKMGPFIFGPKLGTSPVKSIKQYLVRKEGTFKYYLAKVFHMGGCSNDDKSGRLLLYSEYSLLTLLKNHPGVLREHGLYKDVVYDAKSGRARERVCLILDCVMPHEFDPATKDCLVLQKHVMKVGHLTERETIRIFTLILNIVHSLHQLDVVHRDLKLENMVLLEKSQKIVLTNFCLGRHLISDNDLLKDRRGSPAYISPDVLSGKPYAGKPSDMWSLGVVLFMMLYGQFPFYDKDPAQLFKKIRKADFAIPSNFNTSTQINEIIRGLLTSDPTSRLTSGETLAALQQCVSVRTMQRHSPREVQVVPDIDNDNSSESDEDKNDDAEQRYLEEKLTREFRLKLLSDDEASTQNRNNAFSRPTYQSSLPTVHSCPYDARPLTQEEIAMHHQLLVNSTLGVRAQGST